MITASKPFLFSAASLLLLAAPLSAQQPTRSWIGYGSDNNWTTHANWYADIPPGFTENAVIGSLFDSYWVNLNEHMTVGNLDLVNAHVTSDRYATGNARIESSTLRIGEAYFEAAGIYFDLWTNTILGSAEEGFQNGWMTISAPANDDPVPAYSIISNHGRFTHSAGYDVHGQDYQGILEIGTWANPNGGFENWDHYILDSNDADNPGIAAEIRGTGYFENISRFDKTGAGVGSIEGLRFFKNLGNVDVYEGELIISAGGDDGYDSTPNGHTGTFWVGDAATLHFATPDDEAPVIMEENARVIGAGTLYVSTIDGVHFQEGSELNIGQLAIDHSGLVSFESGSQFEVNHLLIDGGTLELASHAAVNTADLRSGTIQGDGRFTVTGDATIQSVELGGGDKILEGTTTLFSDYYEEITAAPSQDADTPVRLVNQGNMIKTGEGTTEIGVGVRLVNQGTLQIAEGTLAVYGELTDTGTVSLGDDALLLHQFAEGTSVTGKLAVTSSGGMKATIAEGSTLEQDTTVLLSFCNDPSIENFNPGERRVSDIFDFIASDDISVFSMILELDLSVVLDPETELMLAWLDDDALWVNAVLGNDGSSTNEFFDGSYLNFRTTIGSGDLDQYLGYWGRDGHQVWAILDHQSEFSIVAIPEPGSWALTLSGLAAAAWMKRRRRAA